MNKLLKTDEGHIAYCLGCKQSHLIPNRWQFNGDLDNPSFTPSLLIRYELKGNEYVCHSFITDGKWHYCSDSSHEFSGQIVDMIEA